MVFGASIGQTSPTNHVFLKQSKIKVETKISEKNISTLIWNVDVFKPGEQWKRKKNEDLKGSFFLILKSS